MNTVIAIGRFIFVGFLIITFQTCIDPIEPEFSIKENLVFIDAFVTTEVGNSFVKIERTSANIGQTNETVRNANVVIENMNDNRIIPFEENSEGIYEPAQTFKANTAEVWRLIVQLEDGTIYESRPEEVTEGVTGAELSADYSSEITFLEGRNAFVPGHRVFIEFDDPADQRNYYLWRYKTFEQLSICKSCERGMFRDGECQTGTVRFRDFDYLCEVPCWFVRIGDAFQLFDDDLSDGRSGINRVIATLPFWNDGNILLELEQVSLSASGYAFYQTINDVINESSGLNAPPPAPLLGNLFNPNDNNEAVLGQFNAVATNTYSLFIDRSQITEAPLNPFKFPELEDPNDPNSKFQAPCEESETRTTVRPDGWID